jgi:hypothetical protein
MVTLQTVLRDSRQEPSLRASSLQQIDVHLFYFRVFPLVLCFYSPYLKKVLEKVSFISQVSITPHRLFFRRRNYVGEAEDSAS